MRIIEQCRFSSHDGPTFERMEKIHDMGNTMDNRTEYRFLSLMCMHAKNYMMSQSLHANEIFS